jgi:DNA primase
MTISYKQNNKLLECYLANMHIPVTMPVRTYLQGRGFTDDTITSFRIGATTSNRIAFPICDGEGNVLGFQTRTAGENYDSGKKYINTPNNEIFTKSSCLFGHDLARRNSELFVVEGNFDVMRMHQMGYKNCVGIMGSNMSERQAYEISRIAIDVCLMFDGDSSGIEGMCNAFEKLLKHGCRVTAIVLEDKQDPDTFLMSGTPMPEKHRMMHVYLHEKSLKQAMHRAEGKYNFIRDCVEIYKHYPYKDECLLQIKEICNAI